MTKMIINTCKIDNRTYSGGRVVEVLFCKRMNIVCVDYL